MSIGKATSITDEVLAGRGNQGAQLGEELVRRHDDAASATREVEADSTVGEQVHGVEAEGRAKQVLADAFEAFFVAAIHSCGGVQIHAVGERDEVLLPGHGGGGGGRGQGELNARGEGGVDVEVVGQTGVGEVGCHSIENPGEVALVEVGQGMEDDVAVGLLLEGAVCGQHVEVDKKAFVRSEALHDGDEAGVQALHRGQSLRPFGAPPDCLDDAAGEASTHDAECGRVVSETDRERGVEREHPLPKGHLGQQVVHPV
jgi:hypothetical protein